MSSEAPHDVVSRGHDATLVEACCDSAFTARAAQAFGAGRIELCGPGDGGTTPSSGLIAHVRDALQVPLRVMIRPHAESFVYSDDDIEVMCRDIIAARMLGADGIVVGPLHADGTVHEVQVARCIASAYPMQVTFHRAFDRTPDAMEALETLMTLGVDTILTAGHAPTAVAGSAELKALQQRAGARLTILAGGSVRGHNVCALVDATQVRAVHVRGTDPDFIRDTVDALRARPSASLSRLR